MLMMPARKASLSDLRKLIVERIKAKGGVRGSWVLEVYYHLLSLGVSPDDATKAMNAFVDEIIAMKAAQMNETVK
jgi:predicted secreted protein